MGANLHSDLYSRVAKLYYIEKMSQEEIGRVLNMSRSNISRILAKCLENGTVEIHINDEFSRDPALSHALCEKFHLKEVLIAPAGRTPKNSCENVSQLAARYLSEIVRTDMLIGITHGTHLFNVCRFLSRHSSIRAGVIQMIGSISAAYSNVDCIRLVDAFAKRFNGSSYILPAPAMLHSKQTKNELLKEAPISDLFKMFSKIDIALLEINQISYLPSMSSKTWSLSSADVIQLRELEAIAEICGRYFDLNGSPCNTGINERVMAIPLSELRDIPITIAMASGVNNERAVLSILKSTLINTLVIDELMAHQLLLM